MTVNETLYNHIYFYFYVYFNLTENYILKFHRRVHKCRVNNFSCGLDISRLLVSRGPLFDTPGARGNGIPFFGATRGAITWITNKTPILPQKMPKSRCKTILCNVSMRECSFLNLGFQQKDAWSWVIRWVRTFNPTAGPQRSGFSTRTWKLSEGTGKVAAHMILEYQDCSC